MCDIDAVISPNPGKSVEEREAESMKSRGKTWMYLYYSRSVTEVAWQCNSGVTTQVDY